LFKGRRLSIFDETFKPKKMTTKTSKIIYWITTGIIFLFEGVMPALTSQTELAKEGIRHLGYPQYFGTILMVFKVLGSIAITIPGVSVRIKEWAYAGLGIDMICAFISIWVIDGFSGMTLFPLVIFAILATSYVQHNKLRGVYAIA
jgi:hypothetical protein